MHILCVSSASCSTNPLLLQQPVVPVRPVAAVMSERCRSACRPPKCRIFSNSHSGVDHPQPPHPPHPAPHPPSPTLIHIPPPAALPLPLPHMLRLCRPAAAGRGSIYRKNQTECHSRNINISLAESTGALTAAPGRPLLTQRSDIIFNDVTEENWETRKKNQQHAARGAVHLLRPDVNLTEVFREPHRSRWNRQGRPWMSNEIPLQDVKLQEQIKTLQRCYNEIKVGLNYTHKDDQATHIIRD